MTRIAWTIICASTWVVCGGYAGFLVVTTTWAMPSARSGGFQPEPVPVSALRAPPAIAINIAGDE